MKNFTHHQLRCLPKQFSVFRKVPVNLLPTNGLFEDEFIAAKYLVKTKREQFPNPIAETATYFTPAKYREIVQNRIFGLKFSPYQMGYVNEFVKSFPRDASLDQVHAFANQMLLAQERVTGEHLIIKTEMLAANLNELFSLRTIDADFKIDQFPGLEQAYAEQLAKEARLREE
jgi:hypothetical protein